MISAWTKHLPDEIDKENFARRVRSATDVLDRLRDICKERITLIEREETDFSPGWEYKQASLIGRRLELKQMLKLLDLTEHTNDR
jgi:hypothetical protein